MNDTRSRLFRHSARLLVAVLAGMAMLVNATSAGTATPAATSGTKVAYSFAGGADGEYPSTDLVVDASGNLYGTSVQGGANGSGTVFRLSPSASGWTHTVVYNFTGQADGGQPYGGVVLDAQGNNLYGTAVVGGTHRGSPCIDSGCGVAFKLTQSGGSWHQSVIHTFTGGSDGYGPGNGLTLAKDGSLFGMTPTGGTHGLGIIYQLNPGASGTWKLKVIHAFSGGDDGATGSAGRLLLDGAGGLFGVSTVGGAHGAGAAFHVTQDPSGRWKLTPIYEFNGVPDAGFPYGGLIFDGSGNMYGTSYYDGANNLGSVYELSPTPTGGWTERVLHSFTGGGDGNYSISTLASVAGNLYGTTSEGGAGCSCGVIFKLTPSAHGHWTQTVVYRFPGPPGAAFAYNGMAADSTGRHLYGTTVHGGTTNDGAIYQFTP
jgi:uncharacterized repeat protein (TIGR03803 family)